MAEQKSVEKLSPQRKVLQTLLILLVVIIAGFVVFRLVLKLRLRARLDAIRAAGYPATCAELDAWYTIPESAENAAEVFIDSFSHRVWWEDDEKRKQLPVVGFTHLPLRTEPLAEETKALVTQYLADNRQALELLHKGAAIEYSRYPVDLSKGLEALFMPGFHNIRQSARLLKLEAILDAENGKPEQAADSMTSAFGLTRSLSKVPTLLSQLVRIACQSLAVSTLERAVNRTEFSDEQLIDLSQSLVNAEDPCAMIRAFVGERCEGLSFFKMPAAQILPVLEMASNHTYPLGALTITLYRFAGLADMDAIIHIDLMNDSIESIQLPLHQREEAANAVNTRFDKTSRIHVLLRAIMPPLSNCTIIDLRITNARRSYADLP